MFDVFYIDQINSIEEACKQCRTRYLWILDKHNDYSDFDFSWEPAPWEAEQVHVWPSQHQDNSGTLLIPKQGATENNYNHECVTRTKGAHRLHIKHTASSKDEGDINTRYISNYMDTMRRALRKTDWEYCWVTSDICTYTDFDFTWHPSEWQQDMLHVFASNEQKFGDTFYVHVPSFLEKTEKLEVLEWFETLHFVEGVRVKRYMYDSVQYTGDLTQAVWNHNFEQPVTLFYKKNMAYTPTIGLWQEKMKNIVPLTDDGSVCVVPREAKNYIKTQLYDYPNINKQHKLLKGAEQDIVFISYDEPNADSNWKALVEKHPRAKRCHGIEGMVPALKAAAELSDTDYYYAVFAKTLIHEDFDFDYKPDYLKTPSHYLFHGRNMSNGLEYGTLGVTMYNCRLVIEADTWDVDFTTSFPVEVVPIVSAYGYFATDPLRAWRSAFRECTKLQSRCIRRQVDLETQYRLDVWTTHAEGPYAEWVLKGARDGVEFANSGEDIMQINNWHWLTEQFQSRYSKTLSAT